MSHTVTLTQKSQNSQVLFFSGLISQCFRPERFNSQAKTSRTNSRTNKPMCKVHDKYRLSYELLSPTTSLSWRMLGWTSSPNTDCAPETFSWWKENYLWPSHLKNRNFSRPNSIPKRGTECPKSLCEFLYLYICPPQNHQSYPLLRGVGSG